MPRLALCLVLLAAVVPVRAQQKNIFDDGWEPAKAKPAEPKPTRPPTPPPAKPDKPATPVPPPWTVDPGPKVAVPIAPPIAPPVARRPVPAEPQQAAVRKVMKEVFARQLTDRTPAGRKALFAALMIQADKSAGLPIEQFVLLAAAHDAATEAGDLTLVARTADDLGRHFDVDPLAIQAAAAPAALRPAAPRDLAAANAREALRIARALTAAGDYAAAIKVAQAALPAAAASGDADLRATVAAALRDASTLRDAAAAIVRHLDRLATSPDDPAANLAVGKHWCFDLAEWPAGLPKLAKGSDAALKALAARELADPKPADQVAALADAWWDVAAKLPDGLARSTVTAHAADLYRRALPALTGLRKQLAERRLTESAPDRPQAAATAAAIPGKSTVHTIVANKGWQDTIAVKAGDVVTITATGQVATHPDRPMSGPEGRVADGRPWGALLGQVGTFPTREFFFVGASGRHVAGMDGMLSFRVNDDNSDRAMADNRGELRVVLTRAPAAQPLPISRGQPEEFVVPATDIVARVLRAGEYDVTATGGWSASPNGPLREPGWKDDNDNLFAKLPGETNVPLGRAARLSVPADAVVRFKIRDDDGGLSDNRGSVTVTIKPAR